MEQRQAFEIWAIGSAEAYSNLYEVALKAQVDLQGIATSLPPVPNFIGSPSPITPLYSESSSSSMREIPESPKVTSPTVQQLRRLEKRIPFP